MNKRSPITAQLLAALGRADYTVVDARSTDAFNGWKLEGARRGGHLPGATDFSAAWLVGLTPAREAILNERMALKNIDQTHHILVYDTNGRDAQSVCAYFRAQGLARVEAINVHEWLQDPALPLVRFANHHRLVPPHWLAALLAGDIPDTYDGEGYRLFDVSWGGSAERACIAGAVAIDTDEIESRPLWRVHSDGQLLDFACTNGIHIEDTVILSGEDVMASFRVAAILEYLGVKDVRVLNGGLGAWRQAGLPLDGVPRPKQPRASFGSARPLRDTEIVTLAHAKAAASNPEGSQLIDVRSWHEHIGTASGYPDLSRKGRPLGCIWGEPGNSVNSVDNYRNVDDTMRNGHELLELWRARGIVPDKQLVFFCGTGWRAAEACHYARVLGVPAAALYSNGWFEWSLDPANPIALGPPGSETTVHQSVPASRTVAPTEITPA